MANVGIMGAGSWGTALALLLHKNGHKVTVWSHQRGRGGDALKGAGA